MPNFALIWVEYTLKIDFKQVIGHILHSYLVDVCVSTQTILQVISPSSYPKYLACMWSLSSSYISSHTLCAAAARKNIFAPFVSFVRLCTKLLKRYLRNIPAHIYWLFDIKTNDRSISRFTGWKLFKYSWISNVLASDILAFATFQYKTYTANLKWCAMHSTVRNESDVYIPVKSGRTWLYPLYMIKHGWFDSFTWTCNTSILVHATVKLERDGMDVALVSVNLNDTKLTRSVVLIVYGWCKRNGSDNVGLVDKT